MERAAHGDREAFASLVDRHKDDLVRYLTRLSGSFEGGEELAQETFLRLWSSAPRYRHHGKLLAYLFRIGANQLRSQQRRQGRFMALLPTWRASQTETEPGPAGGLLAREAQDQVQWAIAQLPLEYREALVLFELEGWSYQRIAEHLACREGTVKSRIFRARRKLRETLTPYWDRVQSPLAPAAAGWTEGAWHGDES